MAEEKDPEIQWIYPTDPPMPVPPGKEPPGWDGDWPVYDR